MEDEKMIDDEMERRRELADRNVQRRREPASSAARTCAGSTRSPTWSPTTSAGSSEFRDGAPQRKPGRARARPGGAAVGGARQLVDGAHVGDAHTPSLTQVHATCRGTTAGSGARCRRRRCGPAVVRAVATYVVPSGLIARATGRAALPPLTSPLAVQADAAGCHDRTAVVRDAGRRGAGPYLSGSSPRIDHDHAVARCRPRRAVSCCGVSRRAGRLPRRPAVVGRRAPVPRPAHVQATAQQPAGDVDVARRHVRAVSAGRGRRVLCRAAARAPCRRRLTAVSPAITSPARLPGRVDDRAGSIPSTPMRRTGSPASLDEPAAGAPERGAGRRLGPAARPPSSGLAW